VRLQICGTNRRFAAQREPYRSAHSSLSAIKAVLDANVLIAVALALTACATLNADSSAERKAKVVAERADARWKAIIEKDFDAAYAYLSPASRATITRLGFRAAASRLQYRNAKVEGVTCDKTVCSARVELTYDTKMMQGVRTPIRESWIIDQGQAWYVWPMT
jgi:hypothetical protein